jgi:hypothetical protein
LTSPIPATLGLILSAAALSWLIKRAALGDRPLGRSVWCWLKNSHSERKQAIGGSRCEACRYPVADLGSVSPLMRLYSREDGGIERREWE